MPFFPLVAAAYLKRGRRYIALLFAVVFLLGAGGAFFFLQKVAFTRVAEVILPWLAASVDLQVRWNRLQAGLFAPLIIEDVQIRSSSSHSAERGRTDLTASKIVVEFSHVGSWFKARKRFFSQVKIEELRGVADFRALSSSQKKILLGRHPAPEERQLATAFSINQKVYGELFMLPLLLQIQAPDLHLLFDGVVYRLQNFSTKLSEDTLGKIQYTSFQVETPIFKKNLPSSSAPATWKSGILSLAKWHLFPNCIMEQMNINFLNPGGLGVDFDIATCGGTVKGSLTMKANEIRPDYWDAAFVAQRVEIGALAEILGIQAPISGILKEGKLTFRGKLSNILDAEASVHIDAEEFRWKELGWQTLKLGADLISRRIAIPEFSLYQKENSLHFRGSVAIPNSLHDFSKTPFEFSVLGDIRDISALAGLLGPQFQHLQGRMTLDGSLWSGTEGSNGYFKLEASAIQFRDVQFTSARVDTVFRNGHAEITSCELWNGEDFLVAHGTVDLKASYPYAGALSLRVQELACYLPLLEKWQKNFQSGAVEFAWQGDGTSSKHSGAFGLQIENFVSTCTPNGVSGNLEGTFSPGFVSCNRFELFRNALRLKTHLSLSPYGVKINDFRMTKEEKEVLAGSGFLPVDLFAVASGTPWEKAVHAEEAIFLELNSQKLELADFYKLIGQNPSLTGLAQFHLSLAGTTSSACQGNGEFSLDHLAGTWKGEKIPFSKMQMKVEIAGGTATLLGNLASPKSGEIRKIVSLSLYSSFYSFLNETLSLK